MEGNTLIVINKHYYYNNINTLWSLRVSTSSDSLVNVEPPEEKITASYLINLSSMDRKSTVQ